MDAHRIDIDFEYLSQIRTAFALHTGRKTSNILEGDFRSVYRGRSMEFDELSEYMPGDEVHDIDWKSSSRSGQVLVRRYVAERKHHLLFIVDSGEKMRADTSAGQSKERIAAMTFGTAAYLADRNGADFALLQPEEDTMQLSLFRAGMPHLEKLLTQCVSKLGTESTYDAAKLLQFAADQIRKRMIIFLITDFDGLDRLDESLIGRGTERNDLLIVNIEDAYLTDHMAYDAADRCYADTRIVNSAALRRAEIDRRNRIQSFADNLFRRARVQSTTIAKEEEITDRVIGLFRDRTP